MQSSFFDLDNRYAQLSKLRDPLIELNRVIDCELFRSTLSKIADKPRKSAAGRKRIDRVLLFRCWYCNGSTTWRMKRWNIK